MSEIRSKYYRLSVKALILNEERNKFLLTKKENGVWDLPGGGLDWGETPGKGLAREINEEMQLTARYIAERPSYFFGGYIMSAEPETWFAIVVYETELESLNFTTSDECTEITFVSKNDLKDLERVPPTVKDLAEQFKPENHR